MAEPGTFGRVAYFDGTTPALVTDRGVIAEIGPAQWEPCNDTWAATFRTGYVDIDWWLDHDGGEDIPWDDLGDSMDWTASEEEAR